MWTVDWALLVQGGYSGHLRNVITKRRVFLESLEVLVASGGLSFNNEEN